MTIIESNSDYNGNVRTETRVTEFHIYEDWTSLSKLAVKLAETSYVMEKGNKEQSEKAKEEYDAIREEFEKKLTILEGYDNDQTD